MTSEHLSALAGKYDENEEDRYAKYQSVIKLKRALQNIELLISVSEDEEEKVELVEMKRGVEEALTEQISQVKALQQTNNGKTANFSLQTLKESEVGRLTKCYILNEKRWRNAEIISIDLEEQTARIRMFGKEVLDEATRTLVSQLELPAYFLKVLSEQDAASFTEGTLCKAVYSKDGEFYPCTIERVDQQGYHIRYKKYNTKEVVKLNMLRLIKQQANEKEEMDFKDMKQLVIPERLKILPNDPENIKKSKKTKVKALKFAFKNAQLEDANKQKQTKWQDFNQSGLKQGYFKTKVDVAIINQGKETREPLATAAKKERVWVKTDE